MNASASPVSASAPTARAALEDHVLAVQRNVRSCTGCGMCCTESYNAVHVLPIEARRIAGWLGRLSPQRRDALLARVRRALEREPRLRSSTAGVFYTCPFLESDFRCALPLGVKPIACLAFNPVTPDRCDQEPERYRKAHAPLEAENRALGLAMELRSIPAAVIAALDRPLPAKRRGKNGSRAW